MIPGSFKVGEVEEWKDRFLLGAENALRSRPRDEEALKDEEINAAEEFANKIVFEDRVIETYFVSVDEVKRIPLRKIPPQKGRFRIVEIED